MADVKISALPAATLVAATDVAPIVSGGVTVKSTMSEMTTSALNANPVTVAQGGTNATTEADARVNLGLGTLATQDADTVDITGGSVDGTTIGGTTAAAGSFTDIAVSGTFTDSTANVGGAGQVLSSTGSGTEWVSVGGTGTVTSVDVSGGSTGLTSTGGPITASGTITLGGTLAVEHGGTGATDAAGSRTSLGLGSMATQNASSVAIIGGSINGATIGGTTAAAGSFTTLAASTSVTSPLFKASSSAGGTLQSNSGTACMQWGAGGGSNVIMDGGVTATAANALVNLSPTGTGRVTINPATLGAIDNVTIGATTASTGAFTDLSSTGAVSGVGFSNYLASPPAIGGTAANNATFLAVSATTGAVSTTPVNSTDIANKYYVDSVAVGLQPKAASQCLADTNITLSGLQTIDGYTTLAGDRVIVTGQTLPEENGIYVAAAGAWSRSTDADAWAELQQASSFVLNGTTWLGTTWVCNVTAGGTLGTTPVTWVQLSTAVTYDAGTGLSLVSGVFALANTAVTSGVYGNATTSAQITVNAQGQITAASNTPIAITPAQVSGLGSMATQNSSAVAVTGGTINGTAIGGTTASTGAFTTLSSTGETITQGGSSGTPLSINSTNTRGGAGYAEICSFVNGGGGTNPNKFWRMNDTGTLELLNSAYSAVIFNIADSGIVSTGGAIYQPNSQANTNPNTGNNNGLKGPSGYIAYQDNLLNVVLGDYTQTGHDTWIESGRNIFFAPNGANSGATNPAISAQLNSSGQFLLGTTNASPLVGYGSPKFAIVNNASLDGGAIISPNSNNALNVGKYAPNSNGSGVTGAFISFVGAGSSSTATYGNITANGAGVSYNTASDARLKENVANLTGCLDKVKALRPVSYDWIKDKSSDIGFIAQEAELVVPESVTAPVEDNPSFQYYQMDLSRLVPVLTAAIQEQQAIIEALQARLDKSGL